MTQPRHHPYACDRPFHSNLTPYSTCPVETNLSLSLYQHCTVQYFYSVHNKHPIIHNYATFCPFHISSFIETCLSPTPWKMCALFAMHLLSHPSQSRGPSVASMCLPGLVPLVPLVCAPWKWILFPHLCSISPRICWLTRSGWMCSLLRQWNMKPWEQK